MHRYGNDHENSSWETLLQTLAERQGIFLNQNQLKEMSNTEFFDLLELARPYDGRGNLQKDFCDLMAPWGHKDHHEILMAWAIRRSAPVITVNFDEILSAASGATFVRTKSGFTDFYPWSSYFSVGPIENPRSEFAIWHAHGMVRYPRSIRLGLTHYMGSVERARRLIYGSHGLRSNTVVTSKDWKGAGTWLEPLFFCPILVIGFGFGKDENLMRWLFLERARFHRIRPAMKSEAWFVVRGAEIDDHRRPFFEGLGIKMLFIDSYEDIYENIAWKQ